MKDSQKYGQLYQSDAKIQRQFFREMVKLIGIRVLYRAPKSDKYYSLQGELDAHYESPIMVGCIFDQYPDQRTLRKLGWVSELQDGACLIHVDYDLPSLQQGALFLLPSGLDDGKDRLFRVTKLSTIMVYPASVTCEIVPEYVDSFEKITGHSGEDVHEFEEINFLNEESVGPMH